MTTKSSICPKCKTPLPRDAPKGLCPECLMLGGFADDDAKESGLSPEGAEDRTVHIVVPLDESAGDVPETLRYFGDYELLEQIATGGMGVVFKARQLSLNRLVAVKLIRGGQLAREADIHRFRIEAEAAANLKHPHIVAIHEIGEHEGRHFFSMDFIGGRSLAALVRDHPLEPARAARLIQTVAEAIAYAHERGVLHRDLKPSNVMIDAQGQPHVTDFGLAKLLKGDSELTQTGAVMGSPSYMSPEQTRGRGDQVGVRSDVYALGAMLYELLTARPPFLAATALETMKLVAEREPVAPRVINSSVPRDLETICLKCLQKEPAHRYASALELAEELGRFLRGEPIHTRPITVWEQGLKWAKRHPARAGLVTLALIAPAIVIAVLLVSGASVRREQTIAQQERNTAQQERNFAQQQAQITRQNLYAVDVAVAWRALNEGDFNLARRSLAAYRPEFGVPASAGSEPMSGRTPAPAEAGTPNANHLKAELQTDPRGFEWRWLWQRARGDARTTVAAHLSWVNSIAYSPDGRFVASASADGTAKLWDAAQENLLRTFKEPGNPTMLETYTDQTHELARHLRMSSAIFSLDSRTLLTCSRAGVIRWDADSGQPLWKLRTIGFRDMVFSPTDSNLALLAPSHGYTQLGLINVGKGEFSTVFTNTWADAVCFAPDGRQFARWDRVARRIWIQTVPSGELVASFATTNMYVQQMAFTPDGHTLAAANLQRSPIELFDVAAQRSAGQLLGHASRGFALAISPDGRWLASGGYDQTIRLWDLAARQEVRQLRGHSAAVYALAFSPDSRRLASGGHDGTVRFWDVSPPPPPPVITNVFGAFGFSSDGRWLVTQDSRNGLASLWELPSRRLAQEWATTRFQSAVFTTNGVLLTASIGSSNGPPHIRSFSLSPAEGERAGVRGQVLQGEPFSTSFLRGIASSCSAIALSPDGQITATGHHDGTVALWETQSGDALHEPERAFTNSVGYRSSTIRSALNPLVFSLDSRMLAAVSFDDVEVKTWTLPGFRHLGGRFFGTRFEVPLAFSPDGQQLALGGMNQGLSVNLWDAGLRQPGTQFRGHRDFLCAVDYSPDGRTLASGGGDGQLMLWHRPTERELGVLLALPPGIQFQFAQLTFSPDGTWLGASDTTGVLHLFHAPPLVVSDRQR